LQRSKPFCKRKNGVKRDRQRISNSLGCGYLTPI
jgi:hypothetical protein